MTLRSAAAHARPATGRPSHTRSRLRCKGWHSAAHAARLRSAAARAWPATGRPSHTQPQQRRE
eukprot:11855761-Alexandrium_andersonii.AAC.1